MSGKRSSFGSIECLQSGRWRARYKVDAQWHNAPTTFDSKTDARIYLDSIRTDLTRGAWRAPRRSKYTLDEYGSRWIEQRPDLKNTTRELYESNWRVHIRPRLGNIRLDKLTPDMVRDWHANLSADLAASLATQRENMKNPTEATLRNGSATVARCYRLLRTVLNTAVVDELIVANPCRIKGGGKTRSAERPTLSVIEVDQLADEVPERYKALVLVLAWVGLRIGEAAALQRQDIDLNVERSTISVRERFYPMNNTIDVAAPKSKAGLRTVALPPHLVPQLREHLASFTGKSDDSLVFTTSTGSAISRGYGQVFRRALVRIGRPDIRVHDLRHTGMTFAAQSGASLADLKQRLGQSSTAAAEVYLHTTMDHGRNVANRMSELVDEPENVISISRRAKIS